MSQRIEEVYKQNRSFLEFPLELNSKIINQYLTIKMQDNTTHLNPCLSDHSQDLLSPEFWKYPGYQTLATHRICPSVIRHSISYSLWLIPPSFLLASSLPEHQSTPFSSLLSVLHLPFHPISHTVILCISLKSHIIDILTPNTCRDPETLQYS